MITPPDETVSTRVYSFSHLLSATIPVTVAAISGSLVTRPRIPTWYAGLAKPAFTPPNGVFAPVWAILFAMMAFSVWRILTLPRHSPNRSQALAWFFIQLGLNAAWSWAFFGLRSPAAGAGTVILLLATLLATINLFWRTDRLAGALLVPYAFWVGYASYLNFAIWQLN
ncbi:TspO/MBR family protein [uncultured Enterovirga sp.]|uniref:TspO/MBR family protein n=1 Tax=uncultured Enterovirga sp. TaxID=2026352 RepID=UPI0035CC9549